MRRFLRLVTPRSATDDHAGYRHAFSAQMPTFLYLARKIKFNDTICRAMPLPLPVFDRAL